MPQKPFKIKIFQLGGRGEYQAIMQKLRLSPRYFDVANIYDTPPVGHRNIIYDQMYLYSGFILLGFSGLFSQGVREEPVKFDRKNWWMHDLKQLVQRVSMYSKYGNIPFLGICWGAQVLAYLSGHNIFENKQGPEVGLVPISLTKAGKHDILFKGVKDIFYAYENHKYDTKGLPRHCILLAENDHTKIQSFRFHHYPVWGIQFHPDYDAESIKGAIAWRKDMGQIPKFQKVPTDILYDDGSKGTPETDKVMMNFRAICESFYTKTANIL